MPKIFISYRRQDSQYVTDTIYEHMIKHFGEGNVFLDVGSIPFGVDFREHISAQIQEHDVLLAIIGPEWAEHMMNRTEQADDFVRIELEQAFEHNRLVVPVLVKDAEMPDMEGLPDSISELQWRNAARIRRQPDLGSDCARLAEGIKSYFNREKSDKQAHKKDVASILPPPFSWSEVPEGSVNLLTEPSWMDNYVPKGMGAKFVVESYAISAYPITNAQFNVFLLSSDGYHDARWWKYSEPSEEWFSNHGEPDESTTRLPDHPATNANWFEANAFALWLSNLSGSRILLPTEQQWQRAAQGDDGRLYPWGNVFSKTQCNFDNSTTTPVAKYQKAASPYGVFDLVGNAWEWCRTDFNTGDNSITAPSNGRVIRGGSGIIPYAHAHNVNYRASVAPDRRGSMGGFRVVRE